MNAFVLIALMAVTSYSTRIAGFAFRGRTLPEWFERFLAYVPIAAFAALIATGLDVGSEGTSARILAVVPAAFVALRWRKLWLTLASGMILYWAAGYLI